MLEENSPEYENSFYLDSYDNYDYESTYRESNSETNYNNKINFNFGFLIYKEKCLKFYKFKSSNSFTNFSLDLNSKNDNTKKDELIFSDNENIYSINLSKNYPKIIYFKDKEHLPFEIINNLNKSEFFSIFLVFKYPANICCIPQDGKQTLI
jgi:hypothetical protein